MIKFPVLRKNKVGKIPEEVLKWREKLPPETVMRRKTFEKIKREAEKRGYRYPEAVAGQAYWKTLLAKYKKTKGKKIRKNPMDLEDYTEMAIDMLSSKKYTERDIKEMLWYVGASNKMALDAVKRARRILEGKELFLFPKEYRAVQRHLRLKKKYK